MAKDMETPHLQLKPEDCSAIGLLILEHMKENQLDLTAITEKPIYEKNDNQSN